MVVDSVPRFSVSSDRVIPLDWCSFTPERIVNPRVYGVVSVKLGDSNVLVGSSTCEMVRNFYFLNVSSDVFSVSIDSVEVVDDSLVFSSTVNNFLVDGVNVSEVVSISSAGLFGGVSKDLFVSRIVDRGSSIVSFSVPLDGYYGTVTVKPIVYASVPGSLFSGVNFDCVDRRDTGSWSGIVDVNKYCNSIQFFGVEAESLTVDLSKNQKVVYVDNVIVDTVTVEKIVEKQINGSSSVPLMFWVIIGIIVVFVIIVLIWRYRK